MWSKHSFIFQELVKYVHNDILNPFMVVIIQYSYYGCEMHYLAKFLPLPSEKEGGYFMKDWTVYDK